MDGFTIRVATAEDEAALSDICVRTADRGKDASDHYSDYQYPGLIWALPYLRFCRDTCLVLTRHGKVVGYAVGTPDTLQFEATLKNSWWPELRQRFGQRAALSPGDRYVLDYFHEPEVAPNDIATRFPAHLHINLLPDAQGKGMGRELLEALLCSLKRSGATGVHLGVNHLNEPVTEFYRKVGFAEIARLPSIIMAMDLCAMGTEIVHRCDPK